MTIKGQNISNFKLLLSAPPLIDEIPVSVQKLFLLYSCWTFFTDLRRLLRPTSDTKTQFITTNTFILFNVCSRSFKLHSCGRIHSSVFLNYSGKFRGSGGILTEPRSARSPGSSPRSELWTLVCCGPGGGLTSVCHHYRQHCDNQCHNLAFIITTNQKTTGVNVKTGLFPRAGDLAASLHCWWVVAGPTFYILQHRFCSVHSDTLSSQTYQHSVQTLSTPLLDCEIIKK